MKLKKLEDIAEIISGQSPASKTYNQNEEGIPFFQGKADFGDMFPSVRYWCSEPTRIALPNDILISVRAPVGPVNICNLESCIGRGLSAIRVNNKISSRYIYYFLKFNETKIANLGVGSTFKAITQKEIRQFQIPIPDKFEDQIRIATILGKAESLIKQRKENIKLLDVFLKSSFIEEFIKKDYPLVKLEDITTKITDGEHKRPNYKENGIPFISVVNISKGSLSFKNCKYISEEDHTKFNKRCNPEFEDIIYTKVGATYGRAVINNTKLPFSLYVSVALIKPNKSKVNPYFLNSALNHPFVKRQADKSIKGAGVPDLHLIEIKSFKIPLPPIEIQLKYASIVERVENLSKHYQVSLNEIENLYASLSQKIFKDEIDLSKIKSELEIDSILNLEISDNELNLNEPLNKKEKRKDEGQSAWLLMRSLGNGSVIEFNEIEGQTVMEQVFLKKNEGFSFGEFEAFLKKEKFSFTFPQIADFIFQLIEDKQISQHFDSKEGMRSKKRIDKDNEPEFIENGSIWFRYKPSEKRK